MTIISDKFSGRSKGFGFAEFYTPEQAQAAIDTLNGQELNGRALRVSKAQKMVSAMAIVVAMAADLENKQSTRVVKKVVSFSALFLFPANFRLI